MSFSHDNCLLQLLIPKQAVKTAASVRNQVLQGFDGLIPLFSDVELFLSTFPDDVNIRKASVDLTLQTLHAIERAITFFLSNECRCHIVQFHRPKEMR